MFIGKWNKSVIITYLSVCFGILAMNFAFTGSFKQAMVFLLFAGIGDLFDGPVARKCKRDDSEKRFGVELDSLADVFNFAAVPITVFICLGYNEWYHMLLYFVYGICQIARLAYFNISLDEDNKNVPVKYYRGVPVTCSAFVFPIVYLISYVVTGLAFDIVLCSFMLLLAVLHILNIQIPKPKGKAVVLFGLLGVAVIALYAVI